jgi:putative ABC transport system permease protein
MIFDELRRDLRFARRSLIRTPVVAVAAVVSIALGIAATTAVFGVVDASLYRPPPFERADRLVMVYVTRRIENEGPSKERWSWPRAQILAQRARSFEGVATFSSSVLALTSEGEEPEPLDAELVSSPYFGVLRVSPIIGRTFDREVDQGTASHPEIVLSNELWARRFNRDAGIAGRTVSVNGVPLKVIGVAPRGFTGLSGRAQAWIPATMAPVLSYRDYLVTNQSFISVVGRLRDDVTVARANAELALVGSEIQRAAPSASSRPATQFGVTTVSLNDARIDPATRRPLMLLLGAAACLLLLACANVAGLLVGRGVARQREIAIRVATGASRRRLVVQLLVESALLAVVGGVVGVLIAVPIAGNVMLPSAAARGTNFYGALGEFSAPRADVRVIAFCFAACVVTTFMFGLFPAFRASRVDLNRDLREGGAGAGGSRRGGRAHELIIGVETALAVVLLFGGGLLATSWKRLAETPVGFDRSHLVTFLIRPSEALYPAPKAPALIERLLRDIEQIPGVEAASVDGCFPVGTGCANSTLFIIGQPEPPRDAAPPVLRHYIGPNHFRALHVPLIRGREFTSADRAGANRVAIIKETAARRFWPNDDPIGQRVWFGGGSNFDRPDSSAEIVGIVGDVAYQHLDEHPFQPDFYTPYAQFTYATRMVVVRTRGDPLALVPVLRRAVRLADPTLALFDVKTMDERVADSWARVSYQTRLLGAFAVAALLLAATGIFAVVAHAVSERHREIGIRVALGSSPSRVIATIGRRGARPALIGLCAGLVVSLGVARLLGSVVYGVGDLDPLVILPVVGVTCVVILGATFIASRRALMIEPAEALRVS